MLEMMNVWAVLAAGVSSMVLGGLWYSPVLFARRGCASRGPREEKAKAANPAKTLGHGVRARADRRGGVRDVSRAEARAGVRDGGRASPRACAGSPDRSASTICSSSAR